MQNSPKTKTKPSCCKTNPGVSIQNKAKKKAEEDCKCIKNYGKNITKPAPVGNVGLKLREPTEKIMCKSKDTSKFANKNEAEDNIEAKFEASKIQPDLGNAFFDMFRTKNKDPDENKRISIKGEHDPHKTPSMALYRTSIGSYVTLGRWKIFNYGEKGSGFKTKTGIVQDFYTIRDECLKNNVLFEDLEFPATGTSLFSAVDPKRIYEWKRPKEIIQNPMFFVDGFSRFDVRQGGLGDCWFLAVAAGVTLYKHLFSQIVPDDQGFDDKYAGVFHFRFWQYGRWIDVVIDDKLPTIQGQLVFLTSTMKNEFWSALLEKAYAKIHQSYESLKGGMTSEAMEDFTGGIAEIYDLVDNPPNLYNILMKAHEKSSLICCSITADPKVVEATTSDGLVKGHAYTISGLQIVAMLGFREIPLIRIRNPWGNSFEWNGAWSDKSREWRFITDEEKKELGLVFDPDGEFWMSFNDFMKHFDTLTICNLNPEIIQGGELKDKPKKKWEVAVFDGEWVCGVSAGGCRNYLESFWHNPQYRIKLTEVDDHNSETCTVIIGVMQKYRRKLRFGIKQAKDTLLNVGFCIYHLPSPDTLPKPLDKRYFKYNAALGNSSYSNLRESCGRFQLRPGTYCIVPSTFYPQKEGHFLLRVYTEKKIAMAENEELVGFKLVATIDAKMIELTPKEKEETDDIYKYFLQVTGDSEEVDWEELKNILDYAMRNEIGFEGFSKDTCRSMVAMLDEDRSGKLGFSEFQKLWISLQNWKNVWRLYDTDKAGTFTGFELREALNSAGYSLNIRILNILMHRYGNKKGEIFFDDFIMCAIKLKTMLGHASL